MQKTLDQLFTTNKLTYGYLIHATEDTYPLIIFTLEILKRQFGSASYYKFDLDSHFNSNEIIEILNNLSLFEEKIYIEVWHKTKPTASQQKQLAEIIEHLQEYILFIFICDKLTKKELTSAWVRLFDNHDNNSTIIGITQFDMPTFIRQKLSQANLTINQDALNLLIEFNMANIGQLNQELNKLIYSLDPGSQITLQQIQDQTRDNSCYNVYQLSHAYLLGNLSQSLKILDNLYTDISDAILIMWIITEDISKLIKLKAKLRNNANFNLALQNLNITPGLVKNLKSANQRLSYQSLLIILDSLANLDLVIKGVTKTHDVYAEIKLSLIQIILNICGRANSNNI